MRFTQTYSLRFCAASSAETHVDLACRQRGRHAALTHDDCAFADGQGLSDAYLAP